MKHFFQKSILFSAAAFAAVLPIAAAAQSPKVQAAREAVELQVQKPAAAESTESRLASLKTIIRLTKSEAQDAAAKLNLLLGDNDVAIAHAAEQLLVRANGLAAYATLLERQAGQEGLSDAQIAEVAASLKEWRQGVFDAVIKQSLDLALLKQGGDVLLTAMRRLDKVGLDVALLQKSIGEPAKVLLPRMDLATKLLARAQGSYQKAKEVFSEAQDELAAEALSADFLKPITLQRSVDGDFISCLPRRVESDSDKQCQSAFRTSEDTYYLLMNADGSAPFIALTGVYRVSGPSVLLEPVFASDKILGAVFVNEVNRSSPTLESKQAPENAVANILSTVLESARPTVQSLIKAEVADIKSAYNEFVAMINLTKQLLGKK